MINDGNITTDALSGRKFAFGGTRDFLSDLSSNVAFLMSLKKGQLDSRGILIAQKSISGFRRSCTR